MNIPTSREQAQLYNQIGLQVLPIDSHGKKPIIPWEQLQTRIETPRFIEQLFPENESRNLAIIHGAISKTNCFDYDSNIVFNEDVSDPKIKKLYDYLPRLTSRTGKPHVIFKTERPLKTKHHLIGKKTVDLKASGGYSIFPFSAIDGQMYLPFNFNDIEELFNIPTIDPFELPERYHSKIEYETRSKYLDIFKPIDDISELYKNTTYSETLYGLSKKSKEILSGNIGSYPSRSEAEYRVIIEMIGNGFSLPDIAEIFRRYGSAGLKAQDHNWLRMSYEKALIYVDSHKSEITRKAESFIEALRSGYTPEYLTNPRTAATDKAVLLSIAEIIRRTGRTDLYFSVYEISEQTGIHFNTAQNIIKRLSIPVLGKHSHFGTKLYDTTLLIEGGINSVLYSNTYKGVLEYNTGYIPPLISNDFFSVYGMGKTGFQMIEYLNRNIGEIFSPLQLSRLLNLNKLTIKAKLEILSEIGLIEVTEIEVSGNTVKAYVLKNQITNDILDSKILELERVRKTAIQLTGFHRKEKHKEMRAEFHKMRADRKEKAFKNEQASENYKQKLSKRMTKK